MRQIPILFALVVPLAGSGSAQIPDPSTGATAPADSAEASDSSSPSLIGAYGRFNIGIVPGSESSAAANASFPGTLSALPDAQSNLYSISEWHPVRASNMSLQGTLGAARPLDVGGGVRVGLLLAGVSFSRSVADLSWSATGSIPHPLRGRRVQRLSPPSVSSPTEHRVFRLDAGAIFPLTASVSLAVFGGPAWHSHSYEVATDLRFRYEYPYANATEVQLTRRNGPASVIGYHAGVDLSVFLLPNLGFGVLVGYRPVSLKLSTFDRDLTFEAPPLALQAGARFRF